VNKDLRGRLEKLVYKVLKVYRVNKVLKETLLHMKTSQLLNLKL
jgi:hypothetical protein